MRPLSSAASAFFAPLAQPLSPALSIGVRRPDPPAHHIDCPTARHTLRLKFEHGGNLGAVVSLWPTRTRTRQQEPQSPDRPSIMLGQFRKEARRVRFASRWRVLRRPLTPAAARPQPKHRRPRRRRRPDASGRTIQRRRHIGRDDRPTALAQHTPIRTASLLRADMIFGRDRYG